MSLSEALDNAWVHPAVYAAYPGYRALLIAATGLSPGLSSEHGERLLQQAEAATVRLLAGRAPHELPEVAVWREAFQEFGVKPREARSSVEALVRRTAAGLPRIDRLTDVYNAVSVLHLLPVGGEDLSGYVGPPRLVRAAGDESFDTISDGQPAQQSPTAGEIVWRDDLGVTCRRWNWRQCVRTRLSVTTTEALFIIDGLGPDAGERVRRAGAALVEELAIDSPEAAFVTRTLSRELVE